jgi:hypothetical protein
VPDWLFDLTVPQVLGFVLVVFMGGTWLGALLVRPFLLRLAVRQADWNSVVSAMLSCFGVFYGLLLGLLAVAAYENRNGVEDVVTREALYLLGFYGDLEASYPPEEAQELRLLLREYVEATIQKDWPSQSRGGIPRAGSAVILRINKRLRSFEPSNDRERLVHENVLQSWDHPRELRRQRMYAVSTGLPDILWYVVLIGAVLTIVFICLFDLDFRSILFLSGLLSFFMATVIGVILVLDRPLQGPRAVTPQPFEMMLERVMKPGTTLEQQAAEELGTDAKGDRSILENP